VPGDGSTKTVVSNGQIIKIQDIGIAMKTCVVLLKLKHPKLTSQNLLECTSKSGRICSFSLDLNNINYLCLAPYSSKSSIMIYFL
jgi:hypothetical protein